MRNYQRNRSLWAVLCYCLLLSACSTYVYKNRDIQFSLASQQPAQALAKLEAQPKKNRDAVLYQLNKAMLLRLTGDYAQSNQFFEAAKNKMEKYSLTSIIENVAAVTINETLRSYPGQPYERLLLHAYMALNYLALGQLDDARVEILQADVKMREWAAADDFEGIAASAFTRYLSGLVFEMREEYDEALIAYRKSYQVYQDNTLKTPLALKQDLLRLTEHLGIDDEHQKYKKEFNLNQWPTTADLKQGEIVLVINQGVVTPLQEHIVLSHSVELERSVSVAVPYYPVSWFKTSPGQVYIDNEVYDADIMEDIDQLARDHLNEAIGGITLRAVARLVVKHNARQNVAKDNPLAGFIMNVVNVVTERADTRSWSTLPSSIQLVRIPKKAGRYKMRIDNKWSTFIANVDKRSIEVDVKPGQKTFVTVHGVSSNHSNTRH